jgi:hypothetical protein
MWDIFSTIHKNPILKTTILRRPSPFTPAAHPCQAKKYPHPPNIFRARAETQNEQ